MARMRMRIGRSPHNEVVIDNIAVSRHHATVIYRSGEFEVVDEGSQNGLYVNGAIEDTHVLESNDRILIGKFELVFSTDGGPSAASLRPEVEPPNAYINPEQTAAMSPEELKRALEYSTPADGSATAMPNITASHATDFYRYTTLILASALVLVLTGVAIYFWL